MALLRWFSSILPNGDASYLRCRLLVSNLGSDEVMKYVSVPNMMFAHSGDMMLVDSGVATKCRTLCSVEKFRPREYLM